MREVTIKGRTVRVRRGRPLKEMTVPTQQREQAAETVDRLLAAPMADWQEAANLLSADQLRLTVAAAHERAVRLTRLAAYIERYRGHGRHDEAVTAQNEVANRVRSLFGYLYPDTILF